MTQAFDHEKLLVAVELLIATGNILAEEVDGNPFRSGLARDALDDWEAQKSVLREQCELMRREALS